MLNRNDFLTVVAREGLTNPRAKFYGVRLLTPRAVAHPLADEQGDVVPVAVLQFAVENLREDSRRRVITLARGAEGYAVWCGDLYTEGRLDSHQHARHLVFEAAEKLPSSSCGAAFHEMLERFGSYPHHAPCHFWKAWHSHQGLCKHVAAALQFVASEIPGGLTGALDNLDIAYSLLMQLPLPEQVSDSEEIDLGEAVARERARLETRGAINQLFLEVAAMAGGPTAVQYSRLQKLLTELTV